VVDRTARLSPVASEHRVVVTQHILDEDGSPACNSPSSDGGCGGRAQGFRRRDPDTCTVRPRARAERLPTATTTMQLMIHRAFDAGLTSSTRRQASRLDPWRGTGRRMASECRPGREIPCPVTWRLPTCLGSASARGNLSSAATGGRSRDTAGAPGGDPPWRHPSPATMRPRGGLALRRRCEQVRS
jgi:hypothetical protein